jgi:hypothetical protein
VHALFKLSKGAAARGIHDRGPRACTRRVPAPGVPQRPEVQVVEPYGAAEADAVNLDRQTTPPYRMAVSIDLTLASAYWLFA